MTKEQLASLIYDWLVQNKNEGAVAGDPSIDKLESRIDGTWNLLDLANYILKTARDQK